MRPFEYLHHAIVLRPTHQKATQGTDNLYVRSGVHWYQGSPMSRSGAKSCSPLILKVTGMLTGESQACT